MAEAENVQQGERSESEQPPLMQLIEPQAQGLMMLAAAVSQLSASLWGLAEVLRGGPIGLPMQSASPERRPAEPMAHNQTSNGTGANQLQAASVSEAVPLNYELVRDALQAVAHDPRFGHDGALSILSRFGVSHGQALTVDQFEGVLKACRELLQTRPQ